MPAGDDVLLHSIHPAKPRWALCQEIETWVAGNAIGMGKKVEYEGENSHAEAQRLVTEPPRGNRERSVGPE